jgi:hypothetical protein
MGEPLAVADGRAVAPLDGVGEGWLGAGEGVAVAEAVGTAPGPGPADEAVAIMTPATIATMPVMAPTASSRRVQEDAGSVPDAGPSPVNGAASQGLELVPAARLLASRFWPQPPGQPPFRGQSIWCALGKLSSP